MKSHGITGIWLPITVLMLVLASACDSPVAPPRPPPQTPPATPPPTPPPTPAPMALRYRVSGIVTDESGSPLPNTHLVVDYDGGFRWISTNADGTGRYEIVFETSATQFREANHAVGLIRAWHLAREFESDTQLIPSGTTDILKNVRLRRVRTIAAGQSIMMSIEPDSSLCFDFDIDYDLIAQCESVQVVAATTATLTVEGRTVEAGGVIPTVEVYGGSVRPAVGKISFSVQAGKVYRIRLRLPTGMAPQRYVIVTSAVALNAGTRQ